MPASRPSRSSALPGMAAAWAANALTSCEDSAISSTLTNASTRMVPWMKKVGRSIATAPTAAIWPGLPCAKIVLVAATTTVSTNAPGSERLDQDPGHRHAENQQHRREQAVLEVRGGDRWRERGNRPGHGKLLFPALVTALAGCGGTGSVECACTMVWCTAGLITSSTGLG